MGISERYTIDRIEKSPKKLRGPFMITEVLQEGCFYKLAEPLITKTLSHTTHRQKTGVYLQTWGFIDGGLYDDGPCL